MHRAEIDQGRSLLFLNNLTGIPEFASWRFFAVSLLCDLDRQTAHQVVKPVSEKPPHSADRFTSSHVPPCRGQHDDGRREYGNRTDLKRSLVMPEFRYYCLNDAGRIMRGVHVTAPTLAEAIQTAHRDCAAHPTRSQ